MTLLLYYMGMNKMRKIILDGNYMNTKEYLRRKLQICAYYGNNLDALWDALSVHSEALLIEFINKNKLIESLGDYGRDLIDLFKEIEDENSNVHFILKNIF